MMAKSSLASARKRANRWGSRDLSALIRVRYRSFALRSVHSRTAGLVSYELILFRLGFLPAAICLPSPALRFLARSPPFPHCISHYFPSRNVAFVGLISDDNMEDESRGPVTQSMPSREGVAEVIWMLRSPGVGVDIKLVVPEAIYGHVGSRAEICGSCWADMHSCEIMRRRVLS